MLMRSLLLLACLLGLVVPAAAQTPLVVRVVTTCGTVPTTYIAGSNNPAVQDVNGNFCTSASVSASITGFPGASPTTGTPISVTASAGGVSGTLPAGTVVVASNVGTTNIAYCKLGATSTTSDQPIAPNGGWFAFTVGAATQLTCITSTSTTTVNMVGGSGLPTGTGGGGGGSGGAITIASGAVSSGAYSSGSIASGAYASGAFASGAFASGSVASGAFASGSLATGSMVDFLTTRGTKAPGTAAANSLLTGCVYTAAGITLTDGQQAACQYTSTGGLLVSVANANANGQATMANSSPVVIASNQTPLTGQSQAQTSAAASSLVAKASAGSIISISGSAVSGSYVMVFDATSAPGDGAVTPKKCWGPMAAAGPFSFGWGPGPVFTATTGITVVSSSTGCFTKTATNANFLAVEYQ